MINLLCRGLGMQAIDILAPYKSILYILISILIVGVLASCSDLSREQEKKVDEALSDSLTSSTETWDVDMKIIEEGLKKVRVMGTYAASFNNDKINETRIRGPVTIHVFDSTGTITTRAFSNRAVYKSEDAIFELYGDVRVNTNDDRHLESEYLEWDQSGNTINTPKFVVITTPTDSIAGTGFEGTVDLTNYSIKEPKGRVTVN